MASIKMVLGLSGIVVKATDSLVIFALHFYKCLYKFQKMFPVFLCLIFYYFHAISVRVLAFYCNKK